MAEMTTAGGIAYVRTPEKRFAGIDDYPYEPRYVDIDGLWMAYVMAEPDGVGNATATELSEAAQEAYRAPFPDEVYMAGARHFPMLVPISPDDPAVPANRAAWKVLEQWTKPVLTLWPPDDPVLGGGQEAISERIPGAAGQPHAQFRPASHFIQEDQGAALAEAIISWLS